MKDVEWQPIDTAPETFFLAAVPLEGGRLWRLVVAHKIAKSKRRNGKNVKSGYDWRGDKYHATHWMPLPEVPNEGR